METKEKPSKDDYLINERLLNKLKTLNLELKVYNSTRKKLEGEKAVRITLNKNLQHLQPE